MGAQGRRRSRTASLQHPRQRLRHRHRSISPATCPSCSVPTARASAASSVRPPSLTPNSGRWASSARATRSASARFRYCAGGSAWNTPSECSHRGAEPSLCRHCRPAQREAADTPQALRTSSAGPTAIATCWSNTDRTSSTSSCGSGSTRSRDAAPAGLPGIIDITPGIRSLQIHYDNLLLSRDALLEALDARREAHPADLDDIRVPSRIVHLPLSWDDPQTRSRSASTCSRCGPTRPWCPSNIEFIRRINGLDSIDDVHRIVFDASYLVLGLGDVYLGAPVATPVDPRHRLVTTKYNPARTWTPENAVGIGGAYLCVYGMEGRAAISSSAAPCRCGTPTRPPRILNQAVRGCFASSIRSVFIRSAPTNSSKYRDAFPHGRFHVRTEETTFGLSDCVAGEQAVLFKRKQQAAFDEERERWKASGQNEFISAPPAMVETTER